MAIDCVSLPLAKLVGSNHSLSLWLILNVKTVTVTVNVNVAKKMT